MEADETLPIRVAKVLRTMEYSALILLVAALSSRLFHFKYSLAGVIGGIALIVIAPEIGVITIAAVSITTKNKRNLAAAIAILLIYALAVVTSL